MNIAAVTSIADILSNRLWGLLKSGRVAAINIDVIRAACNIADHYESLTQPERELLEDKVLRKVVGKVG